MVDSRDGGDVGGVVQASADGKGVARPRRFLFFVAEAVADGVLSAFSSSSSSSSSSAAAAAAAGPAHGNHTRRGLHKGPEVEAVAVVVEEGHVLRGG